MSLNDGYDDDEDDVEIGRCDSCGRRYEDCECGEGE